MPPALKETRTVVISRCKCQEYFPTLWKVFSPIWGKRKIPSSRKPEFPTLRKMNFPTEWKMEFPTYGLLVASLSPADKIWLLALLLSLDSIGFAIEVINPGMMQ